MPNCTFYLIQPESVFSQKPLSKSCKQFIRTLANNDGKLYTEGLSELCSELLHSRTRTEGDEMTCSAVLIIFTYVLEEFLKKDRDRGLLSDVLTLGATLVICADSEHDCPCVNEFCAKVAEAEFENNCLLNLTYRHEAGMYHPKETLVENRLHPDIIGTLNHKKRTKKSGKEFSPDDKLTIIYPFGRTIKTTQNNQTVLSGNDLCFPSHQCLCSYNSAGKGSVVLLGSSRIFQDKYFDKRDNFTFLERLFGFLKTPTFCRIGPARETHEVGEAIKSTEIPNIQNISERLRACLEVPESIPADFTRLFYDKLYKFDVDHVPEVIEMYEQLKVKHEPLALIPPVFEVPSLPLEPAVFPPNMIQLHSPPLELFDLDEEFASIDQRLAQLTNKCSSQADLKYFVESCGDIMNVGPKQVTMEKNRPKQILHRMLNEIMNFKMSKR